MIGSATYRLMIKKHASRSNMMNLTKRHTKKWRTEKDEMKFIFLVLYSLTILTYSTII